MKLELYIRGYLLAEVKLMPPANEPFIDFESNYHVREEYIKWMIESLKNKYQKAIQNSEWEIMMIVESRMNQLLSIEITELKKVV